jgi:hypothetical protein
MAFLSSWRGDQLKLLQYKVYRSENVWLKYDVQK